MPHIILAIASWTLLFTLIKKERIVRLFWGGIIGGAFSFAVDYLGNVLGLYKYEKMIFPIMGSVPIFQVLSMIAITIIVLNWMPENWYKRFGIIAYFSSIFIVLEAFMHQAGALRYLNWQLWYSYILDFIGLSIVTYFSDKVIIRNIKEYKIIKR